MVKKSKSNNSINVGTTKDDGDAEIEEYFKDLDFTIKIQDGKEVFVKKEDKE